LTETLLVLAIVVIMAGVAGLALQRPLARQRLHSAADTVRSEWCQARVDAMKSGHTYAFRYVVRGDRYHLGAQDDQPLADASSSAAPQTAAAQPSATDEEDLGDDPLPPPVDKTLPHGIRFVGADGSDLASLGDSPQTTAADDTGDWSDPIFFYADGSTSDARLVVASDRNSAMRLQLRGVTGSVTVDDNVTGATIAGQGNP
jgi:type II secretory pathway pseudopilin PulG